MNNVFTYEYKDGSAILKLILNGFFHYIYS